MHIDTGQELNQRLATLRGRMAAYGRVDKQDEYRQARNEMVLLKARRLQEVVVDMLRQVTEGHDVSVEATLSKAQRALDALYEVTNDDAR